MKNDLEDRIRELQRHILLPKNYQNKGYLLARLKAVQEGVRKLVLDTYIDPLTGIHTRRGLDVYLEGLDKQEGRTYGLFSLDVAGLKSVNDNFGQDAGDHLIKSVSFAIRTKLKAEDFFCRYGYSRSDEFLIITSDAQNTQDIASRIDHANIELRGKEMRVALYVAAGSYTPFSESFERAYERVSQQLIKKKKRKKLELMTDKPHLSRNL